MSSSNAINTNAPGSRMGRNKLGARLFWRQRTVATTWQRFASSAAETSKARTALFFPGAGSHKIGMTKSWQEAFPRTVKPFLEEVDETLQVSLTSIIEGGLNQELQRTSNAQPAIFATSIMVLKVLEQDFDFRTSERIDFTLGHSLGEFAALVAGGYLSFQDGLKLVRKRGEVFEEAARQARQKYGDDLGMVALVCEVKHFSELLDDIRKFLGTKGTGHSMKDPDPTPDRKPPIEQVVIANINSNNQVVLSGSLPQIKKLLSRLRDFGGHDPRAVTLRIECPFHSPMMQPAADVVQKYLAERRANNEPVIKFPGVIPCISNVTGRPFEYAK